MVTAHKAPADERTGVRKLENDYVTKRPGLPQHNHGVFSNAGLVLSSLRLLRCAGTIRSGGGLPRARWP